MSRAHIPAALRATVGRRAAGGCEYCRMPEAGGLFRHEPDHIIAEQHGGETTAENLALACVHCNRCKGASIASVDPQTRQPIRLFNPRTDRWADHFRLEAFRILPLTAIGRATARLLRFAEKEREQARRDLWEVGKYPG